MASIEPWSKWRIRPDLALLAGFLLFAASTWVFVELADEVAEGETNRFDSYVLSRVAVDSGWPEWVVQAVVDVTALGSTTLLTMISVLCALYLAAARRAATALWLALAVAGGVVLTHGLKLVFLRSRPDVIEPIVAVSTASFPSGHAANSAVVFLTLATILAREQPERALRMQIVGTGIFLTIVVGLSRIVLGVHWPSDVLGGWSLGAGWAALCAVIGRWLELRGRS